MLIFTLIGPSYENTPDGAVACTYSEEEEECIIRAIAREYITPNDPMAYTRYPATQWNILRNWKFIYKIDLLNHLRRNLPYSDDFNECQDNNGCVSIQK